MDYCISRYLIDPAGALRTLLQHKLRPLTALFSLKAMLYNPSNKGSKRISSPSSVHCFGLSPNSVFRDFLKVLVICGYIKCSGHDRYSLDKPHRFHLNQLKSYFRRHRCQMSRRLNLNLSFIITSSQPVISGLLTRIQNAQ